MIIRPTPSQRASAADNNERKHPSPSRMAGIGVKSWFLLEKIRKPINGFQVL
jgi:hypothetical protein